MKLFATEKNCARPGSSYFRSFRQTSPRPTAASTSTPETSNTRPGSRPMKTPTSRLSTKYVEDFFGSIDFENLEQARIQPWASSIDRMNFQYDHRDFEISCQ